MDERTEVELAQDLRESRRILRRIQAHITQAHRNLGAEMHDMGLIVVLYHADNDLPPLNCVIPRRKTAWLPAQEITAGLDFLRERGKTPRLHLIEGLYPPRFVESLHAVGLNLECTVNLMAHAAPSAVTGDRTDTTTDAGDSAALWEKVRGGDGYRVIAGGIEPIDIRRENAPPPATQHDVVIGDVVIGDVVIGDVENAPSGIARVTFDQDSAHIATAAIATGNSENEAKRIAALYRQALSVAAARGCELVFTAGSDEATRRIYRRLGFVDAGNLICYAQNDTTNRESAQQTDGNSGGTALFMA
ncbi:MAG: hypothetical protein EA396_01560 [Anaerolineaceae bacterium]|nr:MAG: hypothetical protein EA396_01560 [Anaerolineaceae bacterium]